MFDLIEVTGRFDLIEVTGRFDVIEVTEWGGLT